MVSIVVGIIVDSIMLVVGLLDTIVDSLVVIGSLDIEDNLINVVCIVDNNIDSGTVAILVVESVFISKVFVDKSNIVERAEDLPFNSSNIVVDILEISWVDCSNSSDEESDINSLEKTSVFIISLIPNIILHFSLSLYLVLLHE